MEDLDHSTVDFIILADRAEGVNGKLYLMGGAWDRLMAVDFEQPIAMSLAVGILVPWAQGNDDQQLRIIIEDADGRPLPNGEIPVTANVGRPPGSVPGQSFRGIIAVNGQWKFPGPGTYRAVAALANGERRVATFYALPATPVVAVRGRQLP